MKQPAVYLLSSQPNGTLYVGVTSNLVQRIWQHREGMVEGFTRRYGVKTLVWYEQNETMHSAIAREKAIKKWNRDWKRRLITDSNPQWRNLWPEIVGQAAPDTDIRPSMDSRLRGNDGLVSGNDEAVNEDGEAENEDGEAVNGDDKTPLQAKLHEFYALNTAQGEE